MYQNVKKLLFYAIAQISWKMICPKSWESENANLQGKAVWPVWVGGWKPVGKPAVVAAPTRLSLSLSALFRENFDTLHFCTAQTDSVTVPTMLSGHVQ